MNQHGVQYPPLRTAECSHFAAKVCISAARVRTRGPVCLLYFGIMQGGP